MSGPEFNPMPGIDELVKSLCCWLLFLQYKTHPCALDAISLSSGRVKVKDLPQCPHLDSDRCATHCLLWTPRPSSRL